MKRIPNITKYKKAFTQKLNKLKGKKGRTLNCYPVGLRQLTNQYFTYEQLESSRRAIVRLIKPKDKVNKKNQKIAASLKKTSKIRRKRKKTSKKYLLIRSTIVNPFTKKPLQVRMGKGKGAVDSFVYTSKKSRIILELKKTKFKLQKLNWFFKKAQIKLPGKYKFFYKRNRREQFYKT